MTSATADTPRRAHLAAVRARHGVARWVGAGVFFTLLAIVVTWPWVTEMWGGTVGGDAAVFLWDAWWVQERVFALHNPWWTSDIFAPVGTYLTAHPLETLLMVLVSPITALTSPMVTYGLLVLATLSAAGLLAWRLGLSMGLGRVGSLVTGALWASSSIVVHNTTVGHYMLLLLAALLPAGLLLARRLLHDFSFPSALILGAFLGACFTTDVSVTAYLLLAIAAVGIYGVVTSPIWRSRAAVARIAAVTGAFLVVGSPVIVMTLRAEANGNYRTPTWVRVDSATTHNADLAQFLLPSPSSRFLATEYRYAADRLGSLSDQPIDSSVALGWATTALAIIGIIANLRSRRTWWLAGAVAICIVLALGPNFKLFGRTHVPLGVNIPGQAASTGRQASLLAPGTWLLVVPGVNDLRAPVRYMQLGALPLVLLAGLGSKALTGRRRVAGTAVVASLCAMAVVEGAVALHPEPPEGERLARVIADDARSGIVVDVPLGWASASGLFGDWALSARAMARQTIHGKAIASGVIGRSDGPMFDRLLAAPLYRSLFLRQNYGLVPPGLQSPSKHDLMRDAGRLDAHWIVVWTEADRNVLPFLVGLGYRRRAEDDGVLLYTR